MKVRYTSGNGQLVFDIEAESARELFSQLGSIQELFEAETKCGMCGCIDIRYSSRIVDEYNFYELACRECKAQFRFGQKKKGGELFPKRKDDDGAWLPNGGWSRFVARNEAPAAAGLQEPRHAEPRQAVTSIKGDQTPEGLQPTFDRVAEIFGWKVTPTRIGPALDQMREEFERNMGAPGVNVFDQAYRNFTSQQARDAKSYKGLMAKLMDHWNEFKRVVA